MLTQALLPCRFLVSAIAFTLFFSFGLSERSEARHSLSRFQTVDVSPDLRKASHIAEANARPRSIKRCWRYVKRALVAAHVVDSYPEGVSAKYAGRVLTQQHGFKKLPNIKNPKDAPVGAVLVYGGKGHGHVEFRTEDGYVSDFKTSRPSPRPLTGVYVKTS